MKKNMLNFRVDTQILDLLAEVMVIYKKPKSTMCRDALALGLQTLMEVNTSHLALVQQKYLEIQNGKNGSAEKTNSDKDQE
jgi:hypothetical protein